MKNSVQYLWLLISIVNCDNYDERFRFVRPFKEYEKIDIPENCTIDAHYGYIQYAQCPDFDMALEDYINKYYDDDYLQEYHEYKTKIKCKPNSSPYKYLSNARSNRNSLELENCQPPENGSIGDGWPRLEYITVNSYGENLKPLRREHFSGLNNLWNMMISTNSTEIMPNDLFADLPKLKIVHMRVRHVDKRLFANLNELQSLYISISSRDSANSFDTSELKSAKNFKELKIDLTNFTHLTKTFFEGCSHVESVLLNYNKVDTIDFDAFEPVTNLKIIEMQYNEFVSLPAGLFSQNKNLESLTICSRNITSLPSGFLSNLPNLRDIRINCRLTTIPNDLIHGSQNIEIINLEDNELTSIPRDFLLNHSKLKTIQLYGNKLPVYPDDYFYNKSALTKVIYADVDYRHLIY